MPATHFHPCDLQQLLNSEMLIIDGMKQSHDTVFVPFGKPFFRCLLGGAF